MENRNIFTAGIINGQYKKGTYYTPEGKTLTGIHVFTTLGRSSQRIVPMISPTARVDLANMNPNDEVAKPVRVIAKINGNVFLEGPLALTMKGRKGVFTLVHLCITTTKHRQFHIPMQCRNTVLPSV